MEAPSGREVRRLRPHRTRNAASRAASSGWRARQYTLQTHSIEPGKREASLHPPCHCVRTGRRPPVARLACTSAGDTSTEPGRRRRSASAMQLRAPGRDPGRARGGWPERRRADAPLRQAERSTTTPRTSRGVLVAIPRWAVASGVSSASAWLRVPEPPIARSPGPRGRQRPTCCEARTRSLREEAAADSRARRDARASGRGARALVPS
jgi:hypothetical protein